MREQAAAIAAEASQALPAGPSAVIPSGGAGGPLFVGVNDTTVAAYRIDIGNSAAVTAFTGFEVWGAAYDPVGDRVFFNNGSTLYEWEVGGTVTTLGTMVSDTGAVLAMVGLAFHNGTLYACKNIANEAIYTVNTTTLVATVFIDYVDADFDCGGLAVNPTDGMVYMTNDDTTPLGSGLFRMNMDGTGTLVAPYPAGQTDIDGLAIGEGRAFLVIDEPGNIFVWDFATSAYVTPLTNPWTTSEIFSAGAFIIAGVAPPIFGYTPAAGATVTATGGTGLVGSTSNLTILPAVATLGTGTGAAATTTLTCTAPTAPFAGFGQTVTAVGDGPISGGPLLGTCTRGTAAATQTLTCSENQGGTAVSRTWTLSCPAGTIPSVPVNATSAWSLIALMLALFGFAAIAARR